MSSTRISRHIKAPRAAVYRALLDPLAVARWKVPTGMTCRVHEFDAREGGALRISLTYDAPTGTGKTPAHTDTYRGRFVKLVPNEQVVEVDEFETEDPELRGEMTITFTLADADGGTDLHAVPRRTTTRGLDGRQRAWLAVGAREPRRPRGGELGPMTMERAVWEQQALTFRASERTAKVRHDHEATYRDAIAY